MTSRKVHNTPISGQLRDLHGALLDIVGVINGPYRDAAIIQEAGIRLDRALFPLLVLIERLGPIGVVDLADRMGRDHTTASRQLAKLEGLGLISRRENPADRRVRDAVIAPPGRAMTDLIDGARDRMLRAGLGTWDAKDVDALVRLMRKLADTLLSGG